jgi:cytochrome b subunit of formate dehydrogenase
MSRRAIRKTDYGTVLLHWTLVALLVVALATGLRIAIDSPYDLHWLRLLDFLLPQSIVWTAHIPVGTALIALAVSYAIYMAKTGLSRRIRLDVGRLKGIAGKPSARRGAVNIILYWVLFLALGVLLVTGSMLYMGYGGWAAELHLMATWVVIGYIPAHIAVHYAIGGKYQLLRIFNPGRLAPPPAEFDPFEIILARTAPDYARHKRRRPAKGPEPAAAARRIGGARMIGPERLPPRRSRPRGPQLLHAHPLPTAIAGGFVFLLFLLSLDSATRETLVIDEVAAQHRPVIDGDTSDPVWRAAQPVTVPTQQGANLDGASQAFVEIRAVHAGGNAYFSFVWDDPTRSLKHLPLTKTDDGWRVSQEGFDRGDATAFFEDKFAVLLVSSYTLIPGDRTFHAGRQPLAGKPATLSGRGLHYTTDGGYADMWQWHASGGGVLGWVDDAHFGPPAPPTEAHKAGKAAYKGGFAPDPGTASYALNFEERGPGGYDSPVRPKRLPKDVRKSTAALGKVDMRPDYGDAEGAVWWLTEADSMPYSKELDARIPVGTVIPGMLISGAYSGDRADIRGMARWASGRWSLEAVRRLDTGSSYDTPIVTGAYMRVSVFDHAQSRHTRHIRPIRLEVNRCEKPAECISTTRDSQRVGATSF